MGFPGTEIYPVTLHQTHLDLVFYGPNFEEVEAVHPSICPCLEMSIYCLLLHVQTGTKCLFVGYTLLSIGFDDAGVWSKVSRLLW